MSIVSSGTSAVDHPAVTAVATALERCAALLGTRTDEIEVVQVQARDWPDSCLGLPGEGEACAEVVTPGYRIQLSGRWFYHADRHGNVRRDASEIYPDTELNVTYTLTGGVTGHSQIYQTDSYRLAEADEIELRGLIRRAGFFDVKNVEPEPQGYPGVRRLLRIGFGRGGREIAVDEPHTAADPEAFDALVEWVEEHRSLMVEGVPSRGVRR